MSEPVDCGGDRAKGLDAPQQPSRRMIAMTIAAGAALGQTCVKASKPLVLGQVNLSFYTGVAAVVTKVLRSLGHDVRVVEGAHEAIYRQIGDGEVDLLVAAWLPHAHGPLHAPLSNELVEVTVLYEDALLYWSVPSHVPEQSVASISDLTRPDVVAKMDPDIIGVGPGSGLMRGSTAIMERYGLTPQGYRLSVAPSAEWARRLSDAMRSGRWMVMPLWRPHHLNALYRPRPLLDPLGIFGTDRAVAICRSRTWEQLPMITREVLRRVKLDIAAVTELDRRIVVDGWSADDAAEAWMMANPERVAAWMKGT